MYAHLRDLLFLLPPEWSHEVALRSLAVGARTGLSRRFVHPVYQPVSVMGLRFRNRVGLAAGLDKDARCVAGLLAMGFGFVEVGTVTPRPQPGNPRPRLFRLVEAEALINRMGFNNAGMDRMATRLAPARDELDAPGAVVGVNVGKSKDTPLELAADDYCAGVERLYPFADYFTINISSPNTPGLRDLQEARALTQLLEAVVRRRDALAAATGRRVPVAAKLSPDLDDAALRGIASVLLDTGVDGVVATNTTVTRPVPAALRHAGEGGGLSGVPLAPLARRVVATLADALAGRLPIIGVGGIHDVESARAMVDAGATLVQIYTAFLYRGPNLVRDVARALGPLTSRVRA
jgi:dihydroorotate dehydrogenase